MRKKNYQFWGKQTTNDCTEECMVYLYEPSKKAVRAYCKENNIRICGKR